jgi:type I restriction enzyme, S subunit
MELEACSVAPENWQRIAIKNVCQKVTSGGTPSRKKPEYFINGSIGWVKTKELEDGFISNTEEMITPDAVAASSAKLLPQNTILLAMYGATVGMLGILSKEMACNQACCAMLVKPEFDRDFLFYQLLAHRIQLQSLATGAAQQNLSGQQIKELIAPFPPIQEQKAIGSYLRLLDDRITLLRETNKTLEAIAQALFKSWFVDFDPVRAKMEGRQPEGMDEATAALFPDSFEESELGLVPQGWRVGCINDLCDTITNGGTPSRSKEAFWAGGEISWYKTGELADGFLLKPSECITDIAVQSTSVKVLPANSVLMAIYAAPTVGRLGVLTTPAAFNQACTGMVANEQVGTWFLYWSLYFGRDWFNSRANGAAQQNISKAIVSSYKVVIPDLSVLGAFNDVAEAIHHSIRNNSVQAESIENLRDTQLPRLISGQLRLPEIETLTA